MEAVDARPDITMHRLSLGMRVKELPMSGIGIIAIVGAPTTETIATFVGHIILSLGELEGKFDAGDFPTKSGFEIVKPQVGLWSGNSRPPEDPTHWGRVSEQKANPRWSQRCWAKACYKQHGLTTRLPGKHTMPKEDDQDYLLTSSKGESAPLRSLKTYCEEYNLVVHAGSETTMHRL